MSVNCTHWDTEEDKGLVTATVSGARATASPGTRRRGWAASTYPESPRMMTWSTLAQVHSGASSATQPTHGPTPVSLSPLVDGTVGPEVDWAALSARGWCVGLCDGCLTLRRTFFLAADMVVLGL